MSINQSTGLLLQRQMDGGHVPHPVLTSKLNNSQDFCVLVQLVPRLLYHPYDELLFCWDDSPIRTKRDLGITPSVLLGVGLGAAGVATGASALALQSQNYQSLRATIDADIAEMENSISKLQESLTKK